MGSGVGLEVAGVVLQEVVLLVQLAAQSIFSRELVSGAVADESDWLRVAGATFAVDSCVRSTSGCQQEFEELVSLHQH